MSQDTTRCWIREVEKAGKEGGWPARQTLKATVTPLGKEPRHRHFESHEDVEALQWCLEECERARKEVPE